MSLTNETSALNLPGSQRGTAPSLLGSFVIAARHRGVHLSVAQLVREQPAGIRRDERHVGTADQHRPAGALECVDDPGDRMVRVVRLVPALHTRQRAATTSVLNRRRRAHRDRPASLR